MCVILRERSDRRIWAGGRGEERVQGSGRPLMAPRHQVFQGREYSKYEMYSQRRRSERLRGSPKGNAFYGPESEP